jgi:hypothetical protein
MLVTQFISALVFVLVFTCCALLVSALAVVALSYRLRVSLDCFSYQCRWSSSSSPAACSGGLNNETT